MSLAGYLFGGYFGNWAPRFLVRQGTAFVGRVHRAAPLTRQNRHYAEVFETREEAEAAGRAVFGSSRWDVVEMDRDGKALGGSELKPKIQKKLATAGSLEALKRLIAEFYYSVPANITLLEHGSHWQVRSGEKTVTPIVVQQGKRFVFGQAG